MKQISQPALPIVFQHIPKTAGVSVRSIIARNFAAQEILHVPDNLWRDSEYAGAAIRKFRFLHGHVHSDFLSPIFHLIQPITFLRNPVERVLSLYFFLRQQELTAALSENARHTIDSAQTHSVVGFFSSTDPILDTVISNYQIQVFLSKSQNDQPMSTWVSSAMQTLQKYEFVGISDADLLPASLIQMARLFGWVENRSAPVVNRTTRSCDENEIKEATGIISEKNSIELQFYNQVRTQFVDKEKLPKRNFHKESVVARSQRRTYQTGLLSPVTMDLPLRCWGWHDRETSSAGETWRCASDSHAGIELRVDRNTSVVILVEMKAVSQAVNFPATKVTVSGTAVNSVAFISDNKWILAVSVDKELVDEDGMISVEMLLQEKELPQQPVTQFADDRIVFLALEKIFLLTDKAIAPEALGFLRSQIMSHQSAFETTEDLRLSFDQLRLARETEQTNARIEIAAQIDRAQRAESYGKSLMAKLATSAKEIEKNSKRKKR